MCVIRDKYYVWNKRHELHNAPIERFYFMHLRKGFGLIKHVVAKMAIATLADLMGW